MSCKELCKYNGGKTRLYDYVASLALGADTFMELCAGSAVLSLNLPANIVINDLNIMLTAVYKALSVPHIEEQVIERMIYAEYSRKVFQEAKNFWESSTTSLSELEGQELCDAAYYAWILLRFSRTGNKIDNSFSDNSKRMYDFLNYKKDLINYYGKLHNAQVFNESVLDILERLVNNPDQIPNNAVIYIDPPYLPSKKENEVDDNKSEKTFKSKKTLSQKQNNVYMYDCGDFTKEDHKKMLELADKLPRDKCKVIISGYDDMYNLYDDTLSRDDFGEWSKIFVKELPVMCGDGSKLKNGRRPMAKEYFFTNFQY